MMLLENIIDSLNKDSYGVFKLKMIAANESYSAIGLARCKSCTKDMTMKL